MAFIFGTASNPPELYRIWRNFITGCGTPGKVEFSGTGNGGINNLQFPLGSEGMYHTFTLVCETTAERGGTFSVESNIAGVLPDATVAQTYKHELVEFWIDFGDVDYQLGDTFTITCVAGDLSKPRITDLQGRPEIRDEVVTLTCISPTLENGPEVEQAVFEVTGSLSGGLPNLVQGSDYDNNFMRMHIAATPDAQGPMFLEGDSLTIVFRRNPLRELAQHWEIVRKVPTPTNTFFGVTVPDVDQELIVRGPGLAGQDNIYYGALFRWNDGTGDAWLTHHGLTGYIPNMSMDQQPAAKSNGSVTSASRQPIHPMWSQQIPYVIIASGRCFKLLTRSNIYYSQSYQGLFLPSSLPKYFGYPYFNGGTGDTRSTQWSNVASARSTFWDWRGAQDSSTGGGAGFMMDRSQRWVMMRGNSSEEHNIYTMTDPNLPGVYPYAQRFMYDLRDNFDGTIPMFHVELNNNYGFLDGVFAVPARDGRRPEDIIVNQDGSRAYVTQNHHRSGFSDFCAFMLQ